jgi:hypothetical protein
MITSLSFMALIVLSLAAFRVTRLITRDSITEPLRYRLHDRWPYAGLYVTREGRTSRRFFHWLVTFRWIKGKPAELKNRYKSMPATTGGEAERWYVNRGHWLGELTSCDWCTGFWVSVLAYVGWLLWPIGVLYVAMPWALAALVGIIAGHESH